VKIYTRLQRSRTSYGQPQRSRKSFLPFFLLIARSRTEQHLCAPLRMRGSRLTIGKNWSKTWTFFEGEWHEGNIGIMGPRTHAAWLCSIVFDGARAFEGVTPDIELHCARVNDSAKKLYSEAHGFTRDLGQLAREGIKRFDKDAALYIRPMYWAEKEGPWVQNSRPRVHAVLPVHLRSSDAHAEGLLGHAVAFSTTNDRDHARRCQSWLLVSQQFPLAFRSAGARLSTMRSSVTCWAT
jgi:hypothetical protein